MKIGIIGTGDVGSTLGRRLAEQGNVITHGSREPQGAEVSAILRGHPGQAQVVPLTGFCTYGPHILMVGHAAQDFGEKAGSTGAAGFVHAAGYIGASLAGRGAGIPIQAGGYQIAFASFGLTAIVGALLVSIIRKIGPGTRRTHCLAGS